MIGCPLRLCCAHAFCLGADCVLFCALSCAPANTHTHSTSKKSTTGALINPSVAANAYADLLGYAVRTQPVAAVIGHNELPVVPYGQAVTVPPRANKSRRKRSVPKLYTGGNVGPGMMPTEYLPVGKPNPVEHRAEGSVEPDRPVTPNTRPADDEAEAFDGFYEAAPSVAEHDRAIREARGNAGGDAEPGAGGTLDSSGLQTFHIPGVGDVDVYADTEPNARDTLAETTFAAGGAHMSC